MLCALAVFFTLRSLYSAWKASNRLCLRDYIYKCNCKCAYVYMLYVYMYLHVHMSFDINVFTWHVHMFFFYFFYFYVYVNAYVYVYMYICTYNVSMHMCVYICMDICMHIHLHAKKHRWRVYIDVYISTCLFAISHPPSTRPLPRFPPWSVRPSAWTRRRWIFFWVVFWWEIPVMSSEFMGFYFCLVNVCIYIQPYYIEMYT